MHRREKLWDSIRGMSRYSSPPRWACFFSRTPRPSPSCSRRSAEALDLAYAARRRPPAVYLTFDDGPNPAATPALLDVLQREGARATFFLIDAHLTAETAPIVRRMFERGTRVGAALGHARADARSLLATRLDADGRGRSDRAAGGTRPCPCSVRTPAGGAARCMRA